jgi:S1-C subfamily serine protease
MPLTSARRLLPSLGSIVTAAVGIAALAFGLAAQTDAANSRSAARMTPVVVAVARAAPAVVNVTADLGRSNGGYGPRERGSGAGVLVHPDGYIVTNSHIVTGAQHVYASLSRATGGQAYEARVVENDPSHDLALLRIAGGPFSYVSLCSTRDVMVGETAIAIGNPYGLGDTVTVGIVSAKGRAATFSTGRQIENLIQTDASINQGNSGGALLNTEGELIGINAAVHANAQGIAFTVPADAVQAMLDRNLGAASRPTTPEAPSAEDVQASAPPPARAPVAPPPAAPALAPRTPAPAKPAARPPLGLQLVAGTGGVNVGAVTPGSNADIAGIAAGDLVIDVDGKPAGPPQEVATVFRSAASGKTFVLGLRRADHRVTAILVVP